MSYENENENDNKNENIFEDVEVVSDMISDDIKNIKWIIETYKETESIMTISNKKILTYQIYITDFLKYNFDYNTDESKDFFNNCIIWLYNTTLFQLIEHGQVILKKTFLLPSFDFTHSREFINYSNEYSEIFNKINHNLEPIELAEKQIDIVALPDIQKPLQNEFHQGREPLQNEFHRGREPLQNEFHRGREPLQNEFHRGREPLQNEFHRGREPIPEPVSELLGFFNKSRLARSSYKLCPTFKSIAHSQVFQLNKNFNLSPERMKYDLNKKCDKSCIFDHMPYNLLNVDISNIDNYIKNCLIVNSKKILKSIEQDEIIKSLRTINHVFKYILNFL
jgi:hypothetical protein